MDMPHDLCNPLGNITKRYGWVKSCLSHFLRLGQDTWHSQIRGVFHFGSQVLHDLWLTEMAWQRAWHRGNLLPQSSHRARREVQLPGHIHSDLLQIRAASSQPIQGWTHHRINRNAVIFHELHLWVQRTLGEYSRSKPWQIIVSAFRFYKMFYTEFHSVCTNLHPTSSVEETPFPHILPENELFLCLSVPLPSTPISSITEAINSASAALLSQPLILR